MYGVDVSTGTISAVTDQLIPELMSAAAATIKPLLLMPFIIKPKTMAAISEKLFTPY